MSKHIGNYYAKFKNLPPPIDYFIVGSFVVLSSLQSYDEPTGFPFRLAVFDPIMHRPRSDLVLDADLGSDNILRISVNVTQFERNLLFEQVVEGLEVFIKVCVRRGARGILFELSLPNVSDQLRTTMQEWGFKPSKDEIFAKVVTPDILTRRFRFHDMEQIYQHPLDIPGTPNASMWSAENGSIGEVEEDLFDGRGLQRV